LAFSSLLTFQENQNNYKAQLTDANSFNESGKYQESNKKLDELLKADLTPFASITDEATKLKVSNDEENYKFLSNKIPTCSAMT
jgi:hypothetical protein